MVIDITETCEQAGIFVGCLESDESPGRNWHLEPLSTRVCRSKILWGHVRPCRAWVAAPWDSSPHLCLVRQHASLRSLRSLEEPWRACCLEQELRTEPSKAFFLTFTIINSERYLVLLLNYLF
uniref:Uncharacterized protein n=1 Tax=Rousettus aegyptiacus TaxID=9407 RepID=A0A7J8GB70_ROUAE|nr:hypothetical protein HJG63_011538 [Rousettus aegyptiacus]